VDFIREVSVQTSAFSAQYGRNSGAPSTWVTKSGTDGFHGSLHEFFRNDFPGRQGSLRAGASRNCASIIGWTLGGPVAFAGLKKGKLYFFGGQDLQAHSPPTSPSRQTLPTRAERLGDFTDRPPLPFRNPGTQTPVTSKNLSAADDARWPRHHEGV